MLEKQHINFLTSQRTLAVWAGFNMHDRATLFHRTFPNKRISVTGLYRLYKRFRIRRKKVRHDKSPSGVAVDRYFTNLRQLK